MLRALASWMVGHEGQKAIGDYGKSQYGRALFFSDAISVAPQK
jgi:hypothetical protein